MHSPPKNCPPAVRAAKRLERLLELLAHRRDYTGLDLAERILSTAAGLVQDEREAAYEMQWAYQNSPRCGAIGDAHGR